MNMPVRSGTTPSPEPMRRREDDEAAATRASPAAAKPLSFSGDAPKLNHNVFRYPAKFHPPVARSLIERFSRPGDRVYDPFCGSGTTLVEANVCGRSAVGTDVDPLAVFVADAKTRRYDLDALAVAVATMREALTAMRAADEARWGGFDKDVPRALLEDLGTSPPTLPDLPKLEHWFRWRASYQLAAIRTLVDAEVDDDVRTFLRLCFASIIRGSSNADPVPVSGLEVTSHMLAKEKLGRVVDPYRLMMRALDRSIEAMRAFAAARSVRATSHAATGDARSVDEALVGDVDAIVTSPPYLTAVDYYRRHTLEMYWLDLTTTRDQRLALMPGYIGRDRIGARHFSDPEGAAAAQISNKWLERFDAKPERARAFRHYCDGMARAFARMAALAPPGGKVVVVAGDVTFCGRKVSMLELMTELIGEELVLVDHLWYSIKNRYMSYARRNDADIAADHVLVFQRR